ncbi:MAG: hypothetical protein ACF8XB_16885 [Planctomycetota bacterium JB042]
MARGPEDTRPLLTFFWLVLLGPGSLFGLVFGGAFLLEWRGRPDPIPFDPPTWILDAGRTDVRLAMVGDLFDRQDLVGMSAEEARSLLGPPEQTGWSEWTYLLGHRGGLDGFGALTLRLADDAIVDATVWFD